MLIAGAARPPICAATSPILRRCSWLCGAPKPRKSGTIFAESWNGLPRAYEYEAREQLTSCEPTSEISVVHNAFRNDGNYETALVWNVTTIPARLTDNTLFGSVIPLKGDGSAN